MAGLLLRVERAGERGEQPTYKGREGKEGGKGSGPTDKGRDGRGLLLRGMEGREGRKERVWIRRGTEFPPESR